MKKYLLYIFFIASPLLGTSNNLEESQAPSAMERDPEEKRRIDTLRRGGSKGDAQDAAITRYQESLQKLDLRDLHAEGIYLTPPGLGELSDFRREETLRNSSSGRYRNPSTSATHASNNAPVPTSPAADDEQRRREADALAQARLAKKANDRRRELLEQAEQKKREDDERRRREADALARARLAREAEQTKRKAQERLEEYERYVRERSKENSERHARNQSERSKRTPSHSPGGLAAPQSTPHTPTRSLFTFDNRDQQQPAVTTPAVRSSSGGGASSGKSPSKTSAFSPSPEHPDRPRNPHYTTPRRTISVDEERKKLEALERGFSVGSGGRSVFDQRAAENRVAVENAQNPSPTQTDNSRRAGIPSKDPAYVRADPRYSSQHN